MLISFMEAQPDGSGHGAGPSPVELLVSSLAARSAFCADAYLARHGYPAAGLQVICDYGCSAAEPSIVSSIDVTLCAPEGLPADRHSEMLRAVSRCAEGLTPEVAVMLVAREAQRRVVRNL